MKLIKTCKHNNHEHKLVIKSLVTKKFISLQIIGLDTEVFCHQKLLTCWPKLEKIQQHSVEKSVTETINQKPIYLNHITEISHACLIL